MFYEIKINLINESYRYFSKSELSSKNNMENMLKIIIKLFNLIKLFLNINLITYIKIFK